MYAIHTPLCAHIRDVYIENRTVCESLFLKAHSYSQTFDDNQSFYFKTRSCEGWTGRGGCVDIVTCLTVASLYLVPAMLAKSSLETSRSTQTVIKGFCMKCARASSDVRG